MGNVIKWEGLMKSALALPGVKVDRIAFLNSTFGPYGGNLDRLMSETPSSVYPMEIIDRVADTIISNHTTKVTAISTAAGIPGGLALIGTIPGDLAQFYWHFLVMAQKLAYVYGWPDLRDENNNLGEGAQEIMTLLVGIGMGVDGASKAIQELAREAAKNLAKRIPRMALTKTMWYPIIKSVGKAIGIKVTKAGVGRGLGKVIPLLGGVISGGMTYAAYKPMAKRLKNELAEIDSLRI